MSIYSNQFTLFALISNYISDLQFNITITIPSPYPLFFSFIPAPMVPWVTEKFLAVLQGLQESYRDSKGSQRQEVIKQGVKDITASAEKDGVAIPPNLKKVLSHCDQQFMVDSHAPQESGCLVPK
jgi:hypothetical protein